MTCVIYNWSRDFHESRFYQIFFVLISAFENPRHKYSMNGELAETGAIDHIERETMSSYKDLLAQREKLEKQIEEAKSREYAEVLNDVKQKLPTTAFRSPNSASTARRQARLVARAQAWPPSTAIRKRARRGRAAASRRAGSPARTANSSRFKHLFKSSPQKEPRVRRGARLFALWHRSELSVVMKMSESVRE